MPRREEILVEYEPPLASIFHSREERERHLRKKDDEPGFVLPPREFYSRRRLLLSDTWHLELSRAVDGDRSRFFLQLVVNVSGVRRDVYAICQVWLLNV